MGDDQCGAAAHEPLQGVLHQAFRLGVQRGGCLIEDEDGRILVKRPCNRQTLALSARKLGGVVAHHGVDALGQGCNMFCKVRGGKAVVHPLFDDGAAQGHVGGNAVVEHHHILADHRKLRAQGIKAPVAQGVAVQQDLARRGTHETRQQVHQGGLACA